MSDETKQRATPGPWRWLDEATLVGDHGYRPVVLTPVRRSLPAMGTRGESGLIEPMSLDHPNARLIAAAPELLKALRDMLDAEPFPDLRDEGVFECECGEYADFVPKAAEEPSCRHTRARAVISKVEGRL
jgi:hypothetical protein